MAADLEVLLGAQRFVGFDWLGYQVAEVEEAGFVRLQRYVLLLISGGWLQGITVSLGGLALARVAIHEELPRILLIFWPSPVTFGEGLDLPFHIQAAEQLPQFPRNAENPRRNDALSIFPPRYDIRCSSARDTPYMIHGMAPFSDQIDTSTPSQT